MNWVLFCLSFRYKLSAHQILGWQAGRLLRVNLLCLWQRWELLLAVWDHVPCRHRFPSHLKVCSYISLWQLPKPSFFTCLCHMDVAFPSSLLVHIPPLQGWEIAFFFLEQRCSPRKFPKKQQLLNVMAPDCFWSGMDGSQSRQSWVDTQIESFDEKTAFRRAIHTPRQISESPPMDFTHHHCECVWCGPIPER